MRYVLIIAGVVLMAWGLFADAGVPSGFGGGSVVNIGLLAEKLMTFSLGAVLFLAGAMFAAAQKLVDELATGRAKATPTGPGKKAKLEPGEGQY